MCHRRPIDTAVPMVMRNLSGFLNAQEKIRDRDRVVHSSQNHRATRERTNKHREGGADSANLFFLFLFFFILFRAAREGQDDDEEIMGTSITCSATGKSKRRKNSTSWFSLCGTGTGHRGSAPSVQAPKDPPRSAAPHTRAAAPRRGVQAASPGEVASVPVGLGAPRGLPPLWLWCLASVPVGRRSAAHCGVP